MENLNKHKLFETIKQDLPSVYKSNVNLIEIKCGILYAWNQAESSILTLNLEFQLKHGKEYPLQILRLTNPPVFDVEYLKINKTNEQCALIGSKGVAIVQIPRRWGSDGIFEGGKTEISCRCTALDERYFTCKKSKIVKQAKWHPGSPSFSHLVVLTTEDTLRVYCTKSASLVTVWHPERAFLSSSMTLNSAHTRGMQTLASLGETAIDFDFMAPIVKGDVQSDKSKVEWPILILRGNGDVFMLTASLSDKNKFKFDGPLPIYPPSDDDYGMEDASSLIILKTTPPMVVIATSSGRVYHSMLLSFSPNDENSEENSELNGSSGLYVPRAGLYLFECIELELGFSLDDNAELYSCPIVLHEDPYVSSRYFCTHEAGLHAVILPIVLELDKYAKCEEDDADKFLPSLRQTQSSVEYLICTKVNANETSDVSSPILGLQITEYPCLLIVLLANGEVTTLPLISTTMAQNNVVVNPILERDEKKVEMESFDIHIQNILKPPGGTSRPILKLDSNVDLSMDSCIEILNQEMDELRDEYFHRYQNAIKEIERRIKLLSIMKENQKDEIKEIEKKQNAMEQKGEEMMRICEEIAAKQNEFDKKTKDMLEILKRKQPKNYAAQRKVLEKLREYNAAIEVLSQKVEETLNKQQFQEKKMQDEAVRFRKSSLYLSDDQQKTIAESLRQAGAEIAELKKNYLSILNTTNTLLEKNRKL